MAHVDANGLSHHVQVLGDGDRTVVFLHGLVMDNLSSWYFTAGTRLAQTHRVVLLDLRGHGRTTRPAEGYRIEAFEADVLGVLDALGIDTPVDLVGNSFGGQLAAWIASRHPDRVRSVALVDAHLGDAGWSDDMAATLSLQGDDRDTAIATHFQSWLGRHSSRKRNRLADTARALVEGTTLVADLQASPDLDDDALARLTMPVLALYGEDSDVLREGQRLTRCVPHAQLTVFPAATHSLLWERTDEIVGALAAWLGAA